MKRLDLPLSHLILCDMLSNLFWLYVVQFPQKVVVYFGFSFEGLGTGCISLIYFSPHIQAIRKLRLSNLSFMWSEETKYLTSLSIALNKQRLFIWKSNMTRTRTVVSRNKPVWVVGFGLFIYFLSQAMGLWMIFKFPSNPNLSLTLWYGYILFCTHNIS